MTVNLGRLAMLLPVLLCFLSTASSAGGDFDGGVYRQAGVGELHYQIHLPRNMDDDEKYPLLLFLHGAAERGSDNHQQLDVGVKTILAWSKDNDEPVIIVAPQVPVNQQWVNTPWAAATHRMPAQPSTVMKLAMGLLAKLRSELPVDADRVYVTGLSMGGFGVWDIIARLPDTFAAAVPICGGGDTATAGVIKDVPLWVFHGDRDWAVQPRRSRDMVAALRQAGGSPKYTEYKGVKHNAWTPAYADQEMLEWLFEQHK